MNAELHVKFQITPRDYRRMMYFNTFARHPKQPAIVSIVWLASVIAIGLNQLQWITLTRMTMFCSMMVSLALPALVISIEIGVWRYSQLTGHNLMRKLTVSENGLQYFDHNNQLIGTDDWGKIDSVYLTHNMLIIYRDLARMSGISLRFIPEHERQQLMAVLHQNLGKKMAIRDKGLVLE